MDDLAAGTIPQLPPRRPHRSRVSCGAKLLPLSDGRSVTARRFRDLFEGVCADLGGADRLSEGQRQLARRASMLSAEAERMEAMVVRGEAGFDLRIDAAILDGKLPGAGLGDPVTWEPWLAVLKAAFGLPLARGEQAFFKAVSGAREKPRARL